MAEVKVEIGDEVVVRGTVIWIDEDGVPRVRFPRSQMPIRISSTVFESIAKPEGPRERKPPLKRREDVPGAREKPPH